MYHMTKMEFLDDILDQGLITSPPEQKDTTVRLEKVLEAHRPPDMPSRIGAIFTSNSRASLLNRAKAAEDEMAILKFNTLNTPCSAYAVFTTTNVLGVMAMEIRGEQVDQDLINKMEGSAEQFWKTAVHGPISTAEGLLNATPTTKELKQELESLGYDPGFRETNDLLEINEFYFNCNIPPEAIEVVDTNI